MANIIREKRCRICDHPIPVKRADTYPQAIQCGKAECNVENHRRQRNKKMKRWRDKRTAADPGFRRRALERGRDRYVKRRLAAGKTLRPRAPRAPERGAFDTFLWAIRRSASGALVRAARAFGAFCSGGRDHDDYQNT